MKPVTTFLLTALAASTSVLASAKQHPNHLQSRGEEEWDPFNELTKEQKAYLEMVETTSPECSDSCFDTAEGKDNIMPLCAITDQEAEELPKEDLINSYSCLCTDRIYLTRSWECIVKACGGDKSGLEKLFAIQYISCNVMGKVDFPKPQEFLKELCIDNKDAPTALPDLEKTFTYKYQKSIPPLTATTWLSKFAATQTNVPQSAVQEVLKDTRTPLTCSNAPTGSANQQGSGTSSGAGPKQTGAPGNDTSKDNKTADENGNDENAAVGVTTGMSMWVMAAGAGVVGVLAVML